MKNKLSKNQMWQTKSRGTTEQEYLIYLSCANDGNGNDFTTGQPLLGYDEWMST